MPPAIGRHKFDHSNNYAYPHDHSPSPGMLQTALSIHTQWYDSPAAPL